METAANQITLTDLQVARLDRLAYQLRKDRREVFDQILDIGV